MPNAKINRSIQEKHQKPKELKRTKAHKQQKQANKFKADKKDKKDRVNSFTQHNKIVTKELENSYPGLKDLKEFSNDLIECNESNSSLSSISKPNLSIDKLTIFIPVPDKDQSPVLDKAHALVLDNTLLPAPAWGTKLFAMYEHCHEIYLPSNPTIKIQINISPRDKFNKTIQINENKHLKGFVRIDFNPSNFSSDDWTAFRKFLAILFTGKHDKYLKKAYVKRIDIALDYQSVDIDNLIMASTYYAKSTMITKSDKVETIYFGSSKSRHVMCAYDKAAEQKSKGINYGDPSLRLEARVKKPVLLSELRDVSNLFKRLSICYIGSDLARSSANDRNFIDACLKNGAQTTIARYSDNKTRKNKRELLEVLSIIEFSFEKVWKKQWPNAYRQMRKGLQGKLDKPERSSR